MKRTKIDGYTVLEMTEEEAMLEFGYDFSSVPGAVIELSIEESYGDMVAYKRKGGDYALFLPGRGVWKVVANRNKAVRELLKDAMAW